MRALVLALACAAAACGARSAHITAHDAPAGPEPLPAQAQLIAGEQMVYEVFWRGVAIGRASLAVDARGARSSFATGVVARALADVRYELSTHLVGGIAREADELVVVAGHATRTALALDGARYQLGAQRGEVPGGTSLHTLHSALGALRAWSRTDAPRGYLWLALRGALYRLDAPRPVAETLDGVRTLRIDCVVRPLDPGDAQVDVTVWLSAAPDRTPVRFVVETAGERIAAQLVETTATLAAR